jgi:hypothetical protein
MASLPESSRAPVPPWVPMATQLDLPLGEERRLPPQRTAPARRRASRRLNAAQAPKEIASAWLADHPLGFHPDAQHFERLRRRHGACPELQSELSSDGYLSVFCVQCRTEARFRVPDAS